MFKNNNKDNYLALCLLDALEDENLHVCKMLMEKNGADPNKIITERYIAPIHYAAGIPNIKFAQQAISLILDNKGDPNQKTDEGLTPLHVAAMWGYPTIVKLLLDYGGDLQIKDDENITPVLYAIRECHYNVIKVMQNHLFEKKMANYKAVHSKKHLNNFNTLTPNRINYNFDVTSPYYINITHRKKTNRSVNTDTLNNIEERENLFELTEDNLQEYSKTIKDNKTRFSYINLWRNKIKTSDKTILDLENNESFIHDISDNDILNKNICNTSCSDSYKTAIDNIELKYIKNNLNNNNINDAATIKTNKNDDKTLIKLTKEYIHTDDENGLVFYEKKVCANNDDDKHDEIYDNKTESNVSTIFTIPLDYDTEALRNELNNYGEPPGPITKGTKKLYTKKLIKYKRNGNLINNHIKNISFSIELEKTLKNSTWIKDFLSEYIELERKMIENFRETKKKLREGHLKTSFIYLLIDPRISDNLPVYSKTLTQNDLWKQFLSSIFYVGKGKSSRPYSHLYDAMKLYPSDLKPTKNPNSIKPLINNSKKIERIIDIWNSQKGVVCLHVFHNILPAEAYTREASIIDCLTLKHLTNMKRGDYYGTAVTWTMRMRKQLGILLLYKAMQIYLAEGESQLMPCDLV